MIEPGQPEAMVRAYVEATEHLPPEAEQSRFRTCSRTGKAVAIGFLSAFLAEPLLAWMGVRAWGPILKLGVILVPTIVVACAVPLALNVRANSAQRMIVMTIGVLAITLPILFQWLGLLPSSYQFENGEITIVPGAVAD